MTLIDDKAVYMMTLKELIDEANKKLEELNDGSLVKDKRVKSELTERRVRAYINSGSLHKPFRTDGKIWYDETHLNKLLAMRMLLNEGVSESAVKNLSTIYQTSDDLSYGVTASNSTQSVVNSLSASIEASSSMLSAPLDDSDESKKASLNMFLSSLSSTNESPGHRGKSIGSSLVGASADIATRSNTYVPDPSVFVGKTMSPDLVASAVSTISRSTVKSIQEYQLDDAGKVFLRVEDNAKLGNPQAVLNKIKQILNIKEN